TPSTMHSAVAAVAVCRDSVSADNASGEVIAAGTVAQSARAMSATMGSTSRVRARPAGTSRPRGIADTGRLVWAAARLESAVADVGVDVGAVVTAPRIRSR